MINKLEMLINEFNQALEKIPVLSKDLKPAHIRVLADLGSVIDTIISIEKLSNKTVLNSPLLYDLEDCIIEELNGAERKYIDYIKKQDPMLLNMAKEELKHAAYYLSQARMSSDHSLLEHVKDYQLWYNQLEKKLINNNME